MLWSNPSSIVYEKKLDSALRNTSIRMMKTMLEEQDPASYNFDTKLLLCNVSSRKILDAQTDNSCYAHILREVMSLSQNGDIIKSDINKKIKRCYKAAGENMSFQHHYNTSNNHLPSKLESSKHLSAKLKLMEPTKLISNLMAVSHTFRSIIDETAYTKRRLDNSLSDQEKIESLAKDSKKFFPELGVNVWWSIHHCYIEVMDGTAFILPLTYLLLIHNKLSDLLSVLLLAQYETGVCYEDSCYSLVTDLVKEMVSLSLKYKDKFSSIAGSLEGMVIGEILHESEDWENMDLLKNIHQDLMMELNYDYLNSRLRTILCMASIPLRNEMGCMSKLLGHPFVDMEGGVKKLHKRTTEDKVLTYDSVSWVTNKAKETYVRNYITRHHKWPPCTISMSNPGKDPLLNAQMRNKDPYHPSIVNTFGEIEMIDWARVELGPSMEFQQLENIIPFLKDKSISVLRNQAVQAMLSDKKTQTYKWEETRLLLYYLLNPLKKLDHQEFLKRYTTAHDLEELADYLIIRLVPKEKEHKIKFRGFGVKTYLDRLRSLAQEKNVAKFLDLYCDEQAMTLSEIDISKRLYALRTVLKAYRGYKVLYVNFDSSGWNNCFRDETVKPVIRESLSKIFGNDVMHRIHEAYEKSLFVVPDGDITYTWEGQQGGIDGLNQYAWVWVYVTK
jgi:hypothetical protein